MTLTFAEFNSLVESNPRFMRRQSSRKYFARTLADYIYYWNYQEIENFVNEMKGLNLSKHEDRQIFFQFFETAFPGVVK